MHQSEYYFIAGMMLPRCAALIDTWHVVRTSTSTPSLASAAGRLGHRKCLSMANQEDRVNCRGPATDRRASPAPGTSSGGAIRRRLPGGGGPSVHQPLTRAVVATIITAWRSPVPIDATRRTGPLRWSAAVATTSQPWGWLHAASAARAAAHSK